MSAFVIGIPVPAGLDPKAFRVRVVVDRTDGADLTPEDVKTIEAVYGVESVDEAKPATKRRAKSTPPTEPRPSGSAGGAAKKAARR